MGESKRDLVGELKLGLIGVAKREFIGEPKRGIFGTCSGMYSGNIAAE